jgi:endo-1,4-beta-xylanase
LVTALGQAEVGAVLDAHIAAVAGHWRGKVYAWDVVNEAITDDGAGYRTSIFFQHLGAAFIERSFRAARAADPSGQLLYNDYGAEALTAKSNRVYTLVRDLKNAGVPIDGVGLQFHVNGAAPPPLADVATNLDRLIALGLTVNFSEIDIRVADVPGPQRRSSRGDAPSITTSSRSAPPGPNVTPQRRGGLPINTRGSTCNMGPVTCRYHSTSTS